MTNNNYINRVLNLKSDVIDCLLSDFPEVKRENLLNDILEDYLALIEDDRISE